MAPTKLAHVIHKMRFAAAHNLQYCPSFFFLFCRVNDTPHQTLSIHKANPVVTGRTGSERGLWVSQNSENMSNFCSSLAASHIH